MTRPRITTLVLAVTCGFAGVSGAAPSALAYCRYDAGYWQVWLAADDPPNHRRLTDSAFDKRYLRAVPALPQVIFRDNEGKLHRLNLPNGTTAGAVLENLETIKDFDFSPTRGFLVSTYAPNATDNIRIWWYSADEKQKRLLIPEPKLNEMPRWIPGQSAFLFVKASQGELRILRSTFDSPRPEPLFPQGPDSTTEPVPSPDGRWMAYGQAGPQGMDLWLARIDGSDRRRLYAGPGLEADACWDAEGQRVFFSTWHGGHFRLACVGRDGEGFRYLTPDDVDCRYPAVVTLTQP